MNASYTRCFYRVKNCTRLLSNFKPKHRVAVPFFPPFIGCSSLSEPVTTVPLQALACRRRSVKDHFCRLAFLQALIVRRESRCVFLDLLASTGLVPFG